MYLTRIRMVLAVAVCMSLTAGMTAMMVRALAVDGSRQAGDAPVERKGVVFRRASISADDLVEVTGLHIYKFSVEAPKGQRFELRVQQVPELGKMKSLHRFLFRKTAEGPVTLRVSLLSNEGKLKGVLWGDELEIDYRVDCEGGDHPGIGTFIRNPALGLPRERSLVVSRSDAHSGARPALNARRLLCVLPTKSLNQADAYPRGEILLISDPED